MPNRLARLCFALALVLASISACSTPQGEQAEIATVQPTSQASVTSPTEPLQATATAPPTAIPTTAPTRVPAPTVPPAPTPDPWAEYTPYTIEALRARSYGEEEIEIVRTIEETRNFTRYLIVYKSDGLRI